MTAPNREPRPWFVAALCAAMLVAAAAFLWALQPGEPPADPAFAVGQRSYLIPPSQIISAMRDPHVFIRIAPPGRPFEIVHDGRAAGRRDPTGVPHIFSINDQGAHDVRYSRHGRWLVACRRASSPAGGCGTWMSYGGADWSVLFPESRAVETDSFVREARARLRSFETNGRRPIS